MNNKRSKTVCDDCTHGAKNLAEALKLEQQIVQIKAARGPATFAAIYYKMISERIAKWPECGKNCADNYEKTVQELHGARKRLASVEASPIISARRDDKD